MSEMAIGSGNALTLLHAHVDSILASSGVPLADRADVAEEMYGHLWLRWHEAVAAGAERTEAAHAAIRSFGQAGQLGRAMTGAYHSRLYATTIGALLPAVAPSGRPRGVRMLRFLVAITILLEVIAGPFVMLNMTPGRALVFGVGLGLQVALGLLAYRAIGRAQRWALRYLQYVLVLIFVSGAASVVSAGPGITIPILAVLGLFALGPAIGPELADWVAASSRPISRKLGAVLVAAAVLGQAFPFAARVMPDPTQVSAADLDLRVSVSCARDSAGAVTAMDVTAQFRWDRVDLFPYGLTGGPSGSLTQQDGLALVIRPGDGRRLDDYRTLWLEPSGQDLLLSEALVVTKDGEQMQDAWPISPFLSGEPGLIPSTSNSLSLDGMALPNPLSSGSLYRIQGRYDRRPAGAVSPDSDPLVIVRYRHMDRFVVQALASCQRSGPGVELPSYDGVWT